jgi:hypothetical protein
MTRPRPYTADLGADYTVAWDMFQHRRKWAYGPLLGCIVFVVIAILVTSVPIGLCAFGIAMVLMGMFMVNNLRLDFFTCPRCGRRFFGPFLLRNHFARRCVYCGLPKWATHYTAAENS